MRSVFDIRNVIAALLGSFGLILIGVGIHDASAHNLARRAATSICGPASL